MGVPLQLQQSQSHQEDLTPSVWVLDARQRLTNPDVISIGLFSRLTIIDPLLSQQNRQKVPSDRERPEV